MSEALRVKVNEYEVVLGTNGSLEAYRHGKPWRKLTGDNLIMSLAQEIQSLRDELANKHCQDDVCECGHTRGEHSNGNSGCLAIVDYGEFTEFCSCEMNQNDTF